MLGYKIEIKGKTLVILIEGQFDTLGAQEVQNDLEKYKDKDISKVNFDLSKVTLIASSGLRVIYFVKERIKKDLQVDVIGAQGSVKKILLMSGMRKFVNVID